MKRWLAILFIIVIFLTCYEISITFGLFETEQTIVVNSDIGKWNIEVNDTSIKSSTTFDVTSVQVNSEPNVKPNNFAPGTEGYFEITIDPNDTEVSIRYDLTYHAEMIDNPQISILGIDVIQGEDVVRTGTRTYTGVIPLEDIEDGEVVVIRFNVEWKNDDTNNEIDSLYGLNSTTFELPIEINFLQYTGENIVEYQEPEPSPEPSPDPGE